MSGTGPGTWEGIATAEPERVDAHREPANALEALFAAQYPRLVRIATRVLGDGQAAEDAAQEAFVALVTRGLADSPRAPGWLHAAVAHLALNALRADMRRRRRETEDWRARRTSRHASEASEDPASHLERNRDREAVRSALTRLPSRAAAVLALRYSGLSYADVAQAVGVAPGSVGTLLRRAERAVKEEIDRVART